MNRSIVISNHVLNTINSLPADERAAIASALAGEMFLGTNAAENLTPVQSMLYRMICDYIRRDTHRMLAS